MKILHVHDSDLDDPRIVTAAATGKKAGHDLYFAGVHTGTTISESLFTSHRWFEINQQAQVSKRMNPALASLWELAGMIHPKIKQYGYPFPHYGLWVEKQLQKIVDDIRPDIIHAHNIIAAHFCDQFGIPMVLDDHEYLSLHTRALNEGDLKVKKSLAYRVAGKRWYEWEQELGEKCPVVTVSEPIADYWQRRSSNVYVIPNYPMKQDISTDCFQYAENTQQIVSVYLGTDDQTIRVRSMRNINGLHDLFNGNGTGKLVRIGVSEPNTDYIKSIGKVPLKAGWNYMREYCHIGLLPWQKHWFHPYCCPNKLTEYAHSGLWVMMPNDMDFMIKEFAGYCDTFETFADMAKQIEYYNNNKAELDDKRIALLRYSKENLIWEKHEHKLLEAYKKA